VVCCCSESIPKECCYCAGFRVSIAERNSFAAAAEQKERRRVCACSSVRRCSCKQSVAHAQRASCDTKRACRDSGGNGRAVPKACVRVMRGAARQGTFAGKRNRRVFVITANHATSFQAIRCAVQRPRTWCLMCFQAVLQFQTLPFKLVCARTTCFEVRFNKKASSSRPRRALHTAHLSHGGCGATSEPAFRGTRDVT
jgi:hypothetical protein